MQSNTNNNNQSSGSIIELIKRLFDLKADTDKIGSINLIKSNVEFQSANAWTLVFAILIASVGLNVNSTAVIIGAMLISPLMGPIVGLGLALGTYDLFLLKKSAKNLAAATLISIIASTIYFLLTPLSEVQSELLARTRPSFFDVLIAFFGGAAGIVAISRKEKGNAIPGVAIATALMPPLCTAGFGLATKNFSYFFGALYLFIINSVFISISTFIFVRYLGLYTSTNTDALTQKNINRWVAYVGTIVLIPSFFMAWYLQKESFFISQANKYIAQELKTERTMVLEQEIIYSIKNPKIKVSLLGDAFTDADLHVIKNKALQYSLSPEILDIRQSSFADNLEKKIGSKISTAASLTAELQLKLKQVETELNSVKNLNSLSWKISSELSIIFPKAHNVLVIQQYSKSDSALIDDDKSESFELKALVTWSASPTKSELNKSTEFLSKRIDVDIKNIVHLRRI